MKKYSFFILVIVLFAPLLLNAQEIKVQNFIGKSLKEAVLYYGKPVHQDKSIPEMISTFFQLPNKSYIFISDNDSVYQAQAIITYSSNDELRNALSVYINDLTTNEFISDTLSTDKYKLNKIGSEIETEVITLNNSKFQLKIVARKTEN